MNKAASGHEFMAYGINYKANFGVTEEKQAITFRYPIATHWHTNITVLRGLDI